MASPELNFTSGESNFTLGSGSVPALTPETINLDTAKENREIVEATISSVQGRKKIAELEEHFRLEGTSKEEYFYD